MAKNAYETLVWVQFYRKFGKPKPTVAFEGEKPYVPNI